MPLHRINDKLIDEILKKYKDIEEINLSNNKIKKIEHLERLKHSIKHINLNYNEIKKIENLNIFDKLETLELSHNLIDKIENLSDLKNIKKIDLSYNQLNNIDQTIKDLSYNLSSSNSLEDLNLIGNEICNDIKYRSMILKTFKTLKVLDNIRITEQERKYWKLKEADEIEEKNNEEKMISSDNITNETLGTTNILQNISNTSSSSINNSSINTSSSINQEVEAEKKILNDNKTSIDINKTINPVPEHYLDPSYMKAHEKKLIKRIKAKDTIKKDLKLHQKHSEINQFLYQRIKQLENTLQKQKNQSTANGTTSSLSSSDAAHEKENVENIIKNLEYELSSLKEQINESKQQRDYLNIQLESANDIIKLQEKELIRSYHLHVNDTDSKLYISQALKESRQHIFKLLIQNKSAYYLMKKDQAINSQIQQKDMLTHQKLQQQYNLLHKKYLYQLDENKQQHLMLNKLNEKILKLNELNVKNQQKMEQIEINKLIEEKFNELKEKEEFLAADQKKKKKEEEEEEEQEQQEKEKEKEEKKKI